MGVDHKLQNQYIYCGLPISIENEAGSIREWTDRTGKSGHTKMKYDYGYIKRTEGNDGEHIDCYVGHNNDSKKVFVVHQYINGKYDEDKTFIGFNTKDEVMSAYKMHYDKPDPKTLERIDEWDLEDFKDRVINKKVNKIVEKGLLDSRWKPWSIEKRICNRVVSIRDRRLWESRLRSGIPRVKEIIKHPNFERLTPNIRAKVYHYLALFNGGGIDNEEIDRMYAEIEVLMSQLNRMDNVRKSEKISIEDAKDLGNRLGIDWKNSKFTAEQFRQGIEVEYEHGSKDKDTDVTHDDPVKTAKVAWAHLKELPDYYSRLKVMEKEGEAEMEKSTINVKHKGGKTAFKKPPQSKADTKGKPAAKTGIHAKTRDVKVSSQRGRMVPFRPRSKYTEDAAKRRPPSVARRQSMKVYSAGSEDRVRQAIKKYTIAAAMTPVERKKIKAKVDAILEKWGMKAPHTKVDVTPTKMRKRKKYLKRSVDNLKTDLYKNIVESLGLNADLHKANIQKAVEAWVLHNVVRSHLKEHYGE